MSIAERLIAARGNKTQVEVCEAIGISRAALGMYELGKRVPRDEIKVRLAKYYNKSIEELFY
ncbi:MAG: helix-turn-helix transcriptional regulator [Treponema sp.]|nr:helix-turn-helix transcriptional regulator [Candidatus Treponema caballi]